MVSSPLDGEKRGESSAWCKCWVWALASWVVLFVVIAAVVFGIWSWRLPNANNFHDNFEFLLTIAVAPIVANTVVANLGVGLYALCHRQTRRRLLSLPTAAALSCLALSFTVGMLGLSVYGISELGYHRFIFASANDPGLSLGSIGAGLALGVAVFPLTIGLAFPLAIPLATAIILRIAVRKRRRISLRTWGLASCLATIGWWLVVIVGVIAGQIKA